MEASSPEEVAEAFAAALTRHDLDAALSMWSEDAVIVAADGSLVEGLAAIRRGVAGAAQQRGRGQDRGHASLQGRGIALATGSLTLSGDGFEQRSDSTVVYARDADGHWRIALDAPWGLPQNET